MSESRDQSSLTSRKEIFTATLFFQGFFQDNWTGTKRFDKGHTNKNLIFRYVNKPDY